MKTEVLEKILERVKPEQKEFVKSELIRVRNDFYNLPKDKVEELYDSHGSVLFLYDDIDSIDPELEISNNPLQFNVEEVLLPEYVPSDSDLFSDDLNNNLVIYDLIDEFCSPDII
jgi:hypothetical protein